MIILPRIVWELSLAICLLPFKFISTIVELANWGEGSESEEMEEDIEPHTEQAFLK